MQTMFLGGAEILITLAPFLTPLLPPAAVFFLTEHEEPPAIERSIEELHGEDDSANS